MKISLGQLDVKRSDPLHNIDSIRDYAAAASGEGSDLLCLPEMATTGFDWKDPDLLASAEAQHAELADIAKEYGLAICGSFLERAPSGKPANTLIYFNRNGEVLAKYRKIHLFSLFNEDQFVEPGQELVVTDIGHCKAGFGICYDLRFPELFRENTQRGAQLQILPAAFPHPRLEHWRALIQARAIENQCYFVAVNQAGVEGLGDKVGSAHYFGHSMIVDPWGEIVVEAGEEPDLVHVEIDLGLVEETRAKLTALDDRRPELF